MIPFRGIARSNLRILSGKPDNNLYGFPDKTLVDNNYLNQPGYF
jgi:hypothetical protein